MPEKRKTGAPSRLDVWEKAWQKSWSESGRSNYEWPVGGRGCEHRFEIIKIEGP